MSLPAHPQSIVDKARRDEVISVPDDDPLMVRATRMARETLSGFLAIAEHPSPSLDGFAVKVAVKMPDGAEFFWIAPFARSGNKFSGQIANKPESVHGVVEGQTIAFSQDEIVDWTYMDGDRMMGNYTARALLQKASPEERAEFKKQYGLDADF